MQILQSRNCAMLSILGTVFLALLDYAVVNVAMPTIAREFHVSESQIVWIVSIYQLVTFSVLLACAYLGKIVGYAFLARTGLVIFITASIGCALANSLPTLVFFRGLQGLGGGCILSVNLALVRFLYPPAEIGGAIALNGMAVALGAACGPSLGAFILSVADWRWVFWINIPVISAILILGWFSLPSFPFKKPTLKSLEGLGASILGLSLLIGSIDLAMHGRFLTAAGTLCVSLGAFVFLKYWQNKFRTWILPITLLRKKNFMLPCGGSFLSFVSSNLYIVAMPFVLANLFHCDNAMIGLLITPWALGVGLTSLALRFVIDKYPTNLLAAIGMMLTGVAFLTLYLIPLSANGVVIALTTFFGGIGFGMFQPPNNKDIMLSAPKGEEGAASGFQATARLGGQAVGAACVGGIYHYCATPGRISLLVAVVVAFLGALITLIRPKRV